MEDEVNEDFLEEIFTMTHAENFFRLVKTQKNQFLFHKFRKKRNSGTCWSTECKKFLELSKVRSLKTSFKVVARKFGNLETKIRHSGSDDRKGKCAD